MRKLLFLLFAVTASVAANAQDELDSLLKAGYEITKTYTDEEIETHAVMPEFPGGNKALSKYLRDNLKYPSLAVQNGFEGQVNVIFYVEKDGAVSNIRIDKCTADSKADKFLSKSAEKQEKIKVKVMALYSKEGIRLVKKMPKWKPGTLDNVPMRVRFSLPIKFLGY